MAHSQQLKLVELVSAGLPWGFTRARVLEVGSLDVNGSVRRHFADCDYLGLDIGPGPGVDLVCPGQDYRGPSDHFDTVISCEAMEHNPFWVQTMQNMFRVCKPGGLVLMTCATTGRKEHGTERTRPQDSPLTMAAKWNYYRNLRAADFRRCLPLAETFSHFQFWTNAQSYDLYFCGLKRGGVDNGEAWNAMTKSVSHWVKLENGSKRCRVRRLIAAAGGDPLFRAVRRVIGDSSYVLD